MHSYNPLWLPIGGGVAGVLQPGQVQVYDQARTTNKYLSMDIGVTTANRATIQSMSACTDGLDITSAAGDIRITAGSGNIYLNNVVYVATSLLLGDGDKIYMGDDSDSIQQWVAADKYTWTFRSLSGVDANGGDLEITLQDAGDGGTGNHNGGSLVVTGGALQGTGAAGTATFKVGSFAINDQAGSSNKELLLDSGLTTVNTFTIASGSSLSSGLEIASGAGAITLDSAGWINLESTSGILATGTVTASNAAGPAFADEAATDTNPTLIPNKDEMDTGIGWASDTLYMVLGGTSYANFSTTKLTLAGDIELTSGGTIQSDSGDITLDSAGAILLDTTNAIQFQWGGTALLKLDDASVSEFVATAAAGTSTYLRAQSGADNAAGTGYAGAGLELRPGDGGDATAGDNDGGAGGSVTVRLGAGGAKSGTGNAGAGGAFYVYNPDGNKYLRTTVSSVGTVGLMTDGGTIYFGTSSIYRYYMDTNGFYPQADNAYSIGSTSKANISGYFGEDTSTGSVSTSGLYLGTAQEARIRYNKDLANMPASSLILGHNTTGNAAVDAIAISSATVSGFNSLTTVAGRDSYIATQSGLDSNTDGGSLIWEMGAAHGSGTGGNFTVQPGATTSGTVGKFQVKDPSSTDSIDFWHDGANGWVECTGTLQFNTYVRMKDNQRFIFGDAGNWKLLNVTAGPAGHLELQDGQGPALAFYPSTIIGGGFDADDDTAGNAIYTATQTGGPDDAGTGGNAGATWTLELGAGSDAKASSGQDGGDGGSLAIYPGTEGAGDGVGSDGTRGHVGIHQDGIETTSTDGLVLENATAATVGVQEQYSPRFRQRAHAWDTDDLVSRTLDLIIESQASGAASPSNSIAIIGTSYDGAAVTNNLSLKYNGSVTTGSHLYVTGNIYASTLRPNTTGTVTINNTNFSDSDSVIEAVTGTMTQGDGETLVGMHIKPTYNQTGSAAASDLVVSRTETAVGTGNQYLADFGTTTDGTYANHTSKFKVDKDGNVDTAGSVTVAASKSIDAYTNSGYVKVRRVSQAAQPAAQEGELLIWRDTDDDKTYLVIQDADVGARKVELT